MTVVGGNLEAKAGDHSGLVEDGGTDLRILILAAGERLLLWRGSSSQLSRFVTANIPIFVYFVKCQSCFLLIAG